MRSFNYLVAENLQASLAQYAEGGAVLKAGGLDLVGRMKERLEAPETVLSIGSLKELAYIREDRARVMRIGCLTTLADMGRSELLKKRATALHQAAAETATPQVRFEDEAREKAVALTVCAATPGASSRMRLTVLGV